MIAKTASATELRHLVQAIRIGAKLTQPGTGSYLRIQNNTPYACALGTAAIGADRDALKFDNVHHVLSVHFLFIFWSAFASPDEYHASFSESEWLQLTWHDFRSNNTLHLLLTLLNDSLHWSREQIAEWLEQLAQRREAHTEEVHV